MGAIYEEIVLSWNGEQYTVKPSFRMVQEIESDNVSIMGVINKIHQGKPLVGQIATIISHMLRSGGAKGVTAEMVYAYLMQADAQEWVRVTTAITVAFIPRETDTGNSEGPADGAVPPERKPQIPT